MVDEFNLTIENAKEYFFLNQCRLSSIWANGLENCKKFREFGFDEETLNRWTNEWLLLQLNDIDFKLDDFSFRLILDDLSYRIDNKNAEKLITIYNDIKSGLIEKKKIDILFKHEYSKVLKEHYYYGLIYIAAKNKMQESLSPLLAELNSLLQDYPQETKKQYDKYLKKMFKEQNIKLSN